MPPNEIRVNESIASARTVHPVCSLRKLTVAEDTLTVFKYVRHYGSNIHISEFKVGTVQGGLCWPPKTPAAELDVTKCFFVCS